MCMLVGMVVWWRKRTLCDCTAVQMDEEAGWWATSGYIGLPPLARVMGVGRQQQQRHS